MIVTIDGPAGAGKSTVARRLAERLGFEFLDTGAMYRALTWWCLQQGLDLQDEASVAAAGPSVKIRFDGPCVFVNEQDVSREIRTPQVTVESRHIAGNDAVRGQFVVRQRQLAEGRDIVTEGRDQGTLVFPQAECKFFLTADPITRARRRWEELDRRGEKHSLEELLAQQTSRDARDAARQYGAMLPAADAVVLDTTHFSQEEVLARLESLVQSRRGSRGE